MMDSQELQFPVLALHGWLDNANSFVPLIPHLIETASEIIAIDLAGHGYSQHRAVGNHYYFLDYVFDVIDLVDKLGWKQFRLVGHSMGAGIASLVAAIIPERVNRLVLLDGIGPLSAHKDHCVSQLRKSIRMHQGYASRVRKMTYLNWDTLIERRAKAGNISHQAAELLVRRNARECDGEIIWIADRRLNIVSPMYLSEQQVLSFLSSIEAPVLLVKAKQGLLSQSAQLGHRLSSVNQLKVVELSGGHHLHMESPQRVAEYVSVFFKMET